MSPPTKAKDVAEDVGGTHHGPTLAVYFVIFAALLVLTAATVGAAYLNLGRWAAPVAVAIASVKATLVVLYFMHVRYGSRLIMLHAASGFLFLAILLGITMAEVFGRGGPSASDPLRPGGVPPGRPAPGLHAP